MALSFAAPPRPRARSPRAQWEHAALRSVGALACLLPWAAGACTPERHIPPTAPSDAASEAPSPDASTGDDEPSGPQHLRIVTWNVRNFFDTVDDPDTYDEVPSRSEFQRKLRQIGGVLRRIDADVVLLQEVEHAALLDALAEGPLREQGYTERVLLEGHDPRGIDVAALSKLPFRRVASHREERFPSPDGSGTRRFARDLLELFVRAGGRELIVATTHFRSQRDGTEADAHRLAEATQAWRIVSRRAETGYPLYLLAGDLNDALDSEPLRALTADDILLPLVPRLLPERERWSYRTGSRRALIDHALASPPLLAALRHIEGRFERTDSVWEASDHAPLVIDLVFSSP